MRSIGLDIHRDFMEVAIAEGGEIRSAGRVELRPASLELFAQSLVASPHRYWEAALARLSA